MRPKNIKEFFGGKILFQENEEEISDYVQSDRLEKLGGLKRAFQTNDHYTPTKLANYLKALNP